MIKQLIKADLEKAIAKLGLEVSGEVDVARTNDSKFGDFSTNVSLKIRRGKQQSPTEIANKLADNLKDLPYIEKLEIKEPGFVNFFIKDSFWQEQVSDVLKQGKKYGSNGIGRGKKARVEFVSANPTGPLHFGNARGGPIGDSLASVLEFCGYQVLREYYLNDVGVQVNKLGESIVNIGKGEKLENQEYKGEYVRELANVILGSETTLESDSGQAGMTVDQVGQKAVEILSKEAIEDCKALGITFDKVYKESDFIESGKTKKVLGELEKKGVLKQKDDALWFAPNDEFLKDRETVVKKTDGSYTYFANDIAYHNLKVVEGYDLIIDVFGANHHGHVPRLQAAILSLDGDVRQFFVILYQWVRFLQGKELAKMSKRAGTILTAQEVLKAVGIDAVRFFILSRDPNSFIDFDLDLAREQSNKNPVYYVQYAYARISSILAKSDSKHVILGNEVTPESGDNKILNKNAYFSMTQNQVQDDDMKDSGQAGMAINYQLLTTNYELDLIKQITKLPELVENIAGNFGVNQLTTYSTSLADSFHSFYENCQVISEDKKLEAARLGLVEATKIALENTLNLLGVSAPDKM